VTFRLETIKRSGEIERVSRLGRSFASPLFVMVCLPVKNGPPRLAIKVSRKVGGAVVRNRIRRRVKSILRELFARLARPVDCVVIGRQPAPDATFDRMKQELAGLLGRHGCLGKRKPGPREGASDAAEPARARRD
jgi:ribonuclease P protein component